MMFIADSAAAEAMFTALLAWAAARQQALSSNPLPAARRERNPSQFNQLVRATYRVLMEHGQ